MGTKERIQKLEKKVNPFGADFVLRIFYPDDYEGEIPDGCHRESEAAELTRGEQPTPGLILYPLGRSKPIPGNDEKGVEPQPIP